jgi:hypothetical protein
VAGTIWVVFFCACFVQRKPQPPPVEEVFCDDETTWPGDMMMMKKSQREDELTLAPLLLRLTNAIELCERSTSSTWCCARSSSVATCRYFLRSRFGPNSPTAPINRRGGRVQEWRRTSA